VEAAEYVDAASSTVLVEDLVKLKGMANIFFEVGLGFVRSGIFVDFEMLGSCLALAKDSGTGAEAGFVVEECGM
jgi:hypothetical protein